MGRRPVRRSPQKARSESRDSPLLDREHAILTPHSASYSEESLVELQTRAAQQIALVLSGREPRNAVNVMQLPVAKAA